MLRFVKIALVFLALLIINYSPVSAQHHSEESDHSSDTAIENPGHDTDSHGKEEFDAGKFVIEHVSDAYEWHITSFGETHISVPLPVILYSKHPELHDGKSFFVFMSSKFITGTVRTKDFKFLTAKNLKEKYLNSMLMVMS